MAICYCPVLVRQAAKAKLNYIKWCTQAMSSHVLGYVLREAKEVCLSSSDVIAPNPASRDVARPQL
eukprot:846772-Amphidinium_carterae.1